MKYLLFLFIIIAFNACDKPIEALQRGELAIEWTDSLQGDYSFTKEWDYPEGVYRNEFGQLSCDGFCPEGIDRMRDSMGIIFKDSLTAFYAMVDTTHEAHTLKSETNCYEWAGTNQIMALLSDTLKCYSLCNAATHCSLQFYITGNKCRPVISLNSIHSGEKKIDDLANGYIKIDKPKFKRGILKAEFEMKFNNSAEPDKPMWWKGKMYASIHPAKQL